METGRNLEDVVKEVAEETEGVAEEVEVACFSQDVADHRLGKGDDDDNVRPEQPKGGNDGGECGI